MQLRVNLDKEIDRDQVSFFIGSKTLKNLAEGFLRVEILLEDIVRTESLKTVPEKVRHQDTYGTSLQVCNFVPEKVLKFLIQMCDLAHPD